MKSLMKPISLQYSLENVKTRLYFNKIMWIYKNLLQLCTFRNQIKYEIKIWNTYLCVAFVKNTRYSVVQNRLKVVSQVITGKRL